MGILRYAWTGLKFLLISTILQIIYSFFNWLITLMFKNSIIDMIIATMFKKCSNPDLVASGAAQCIPVVSQFAFIILIIFIILYVLTAIIIAGYLCQNVLNWE